MFDVGFSELMVIAVVALVVIGPERLPSVARTLGHLLGRLQRYVNDVKADISREIELDELKKFKNQFEEAAQSVESSVRNEVASTEATFNELAAQVEPGAQPPGDATAAALPASPDAASDQVSGEAVAPAVAQDTPVPAAEQKTAA